MSQLINSLSTSTRAATISTTLREGLYILAGACFLTICAQIRLPLYPIPATLQTFALALLILHHPRRAFDSMLAYLLLASCGLPVLAGGNFQILWILRPTAGYLISMLLSAWISRFFLTTSSSWKNRIIFLSASMLGTLSLGTLVLGFYVGFEKAIWLGFIPFLLPDLVKLFAAVSLFGTCHRKK